MREYTLWGGASGGDTVVRVLLRFSSHVLRCLMPRDSMEPLLPAAALFSEHMARATSRLLSPKSIAASISTRSLPPKPRSTMLARSMKDISSEDKVLSKSKIAIRLASVYGDSCS